MEPIAAQQSPHALVGERPVQTLSRALRSEKTNAMQNKWRAGVFHHQKLRDYKKHAIAKHPHEADSSNYKFADVCNLLLCRMGAGLWFS